MDEKRKARSQTIVLLTWVFGGLAGTMIFDLDGDGAVALCFLLSFVAGVILDRFLCSFEQKSFDEGYKAAEASRSTQTQPEEEK